MACSVSQSIPCRAMIRSMCRWRNNNTPISQRNTLQALKKLLGQGIVVVQEAETNDAGRQRVPGILDHSQAVIADAEPPQSLQPTDGPLPHPPALPQPAAVGGPPPRDVRLDAQPRQDPPRRLTVVP